MVCSSRPTRSRRSRRALLLHYAGLDQRINAGIAAYEAALKANHKRYTIYIYPNVNHAFNNDTSSRYDKGGRRPCLGPHHRVFQGATRRAAEENRVVGPREPRYVLRQ